jgi:hypothetical protein
VPFGGFALICEAVDLPEELAYKYFGFNGVADAAKPCEVRIDFHISLLLFAALFCHPAPLETNPQKRQQASERTSNWLVG